MKNAIQKTGKLMIPLLIVLFVMVESVSATGVSVSTQNIVFNLFQGESAQSEFFVGNPSNSENEVWLDAEGACSPWLSFSEDIVIIPARDDKKIIVYSNIPDSIDPDEYSCKIKIGTSSTEEATGTAVSLVLTTELTVTVHVESIEQVDAFIQSFTVSSDTGNNKVKFKVSYVNSGNSETTPQSLNIAIKEGKDGTGEVVQNIGTDDIPSAVPGEKESVEMEIDTEALDSGSYTAIANLVVTDYLTLVGTKKFNIFHEEAESTLFLGDKEKEPAQPVIVINELISGKTAVSVTVIIGMFLLAFAVIVKRKVHANKDEKSKEEVAAQYQQQRAQEPASNINQYPQQPQGENYPDYYNQEKKDE